MPIRDLLIRISAKNLTRRAVRSVLDSLSSVRARAVAVGAAITGSLAVGGGGALFKGSISSASDFQSALKIVQAVTSATGDEIALLEEKANELGRTTSFTATQAAQGLEILGRAGFSVKEARDAIESTLRLSIAAGSDLAESAGIVNTAIKGFQLEAADAENVVDILAATSNNAAITIRELGFGLGVAGAAGVQAGEDLQTVAAAIAIVRDNGIRAERASTAVQKAFEELTDPTSNITSKLRELGTESVDFRTNLNAIATAGPKTGEVLRELGAEARLAVQQFIRGGPDGIDNFIAKLGEVDGAGAKTANTIAATLANSFKVLESALDSVERFLTKPILEPLEKDIRSLAAEIVAFTEAGGLDDFRQGILDAFTQASTEIRQFLTEFDFRAASRDLGDFARGFVDAFGTISQLASDTALIVNTAISAIANGFNISRAVFNTIIGDTEAADAAFAKFDQTNSELSENARKLRDRLAEADEATKGLGVSADTTTGEVADLGSAAENAAGQVDQLKEAEQDAAAGVDQLTEAQRNNIAELDRLIAIKEQQDVIDQRSIDSLRAQRDAIVSSADATRQQADDTDRAAQAQQVYQATLDNLNSARDRGQISETQYQQRLAQTEQTLKDSTRTTTSASNAQSAYDQTIKNLERSLASGSISQTEFNERVQGTAKRFAEAATASEGLAEGTRKTGQAAQGAVKEIGGIRAAFDGSQESVEAVTAAIQKGNEERADARKATDGIVVGQRDLTDEVSRTADAWRNVNDNVNAFGDAIDDQGFKLDSNGDRIQAVSETFLRNFERVTGVTDELNAALDGTGGSLQQAAANARSALNNVEELGSNQLDPLRSALAQADQQLAQFAERAERLQERVNQRAAELAGEGEESRIEQRRLDALEEVADLREQSNNADAQQLAEIERQINENADAERRQLTESQREREQQDEAREKASADRAERDRQRDRERADRLRDQTRQEASNDSERDRRAESSHRAALQRESELREAQALTRDEALSAIDTIANRRERSNGLLDKLNRNNPADGDLIRQLRAADDSVRQLRS